MTSIVTHRVSAEPPAQLLPVTVGYVVRAVVSQLERMRGPRFESTRGSDIDDMHLGRGGTLL